MILTPLALVFSILALVWSLIDGAHLRRQLRKLQEEDKDQ